MHSRSLFASIFVLSSLGSAFAADPAPSNTATKGKVKVELAADVTAVAPGETFRLGVFVRPDPEWHVYWKFAGDTGLPTEVRWTGFDGLDFGALQWPLPDRIPDKIGGRSFGYDNEVLLTSEVRVPDDLLEGTEVPLEAKVEWLVCKENCIQGSATVALKLPVRAGPKESRKSSHAAAFDAWAAKEPERKKLLDRLQAGTLPEGWDADLTYWEPGSKAVATRAASVRSHVACPAQAGGARVSAFTAPPTASLP